MDNLFIIDKENSKYLVRSTLEKWIVIASYRKPRKSKKGYVGSRYKQEVKKEFASNYEANAIEMFECYKQEYSYLLSTKEIIAGYVNCSPIIRYYVTCPKCGKDAEIISFMMLFCSDEGESMNVCCQHCSDNPNDFMTWSFNKIGKCYDTSFFRNKEELNWKKEIDVQGMKWEDWINETN